MKIKTIYKLMAVAMMSLPLASCNDWLDNVDNKTVVDESQGWDTEDHVDMQVNYFYCYINSWGFYNGGDFNGNLTEALTDCFKYNHAELGVRAQQAYQYATQKDFMGPNQNALSGWSSVYTQVRYIHQFLAGLDKFSTFSEEQNLRWKAQARFFRAFLYFHLAKRYDKIILYDALPEGTDKGLSDKEDVWDFIQADLDYAIENLPDSWKVGEDIGDVGRLTKLMVQAFKSRVMLYAERWQEAYDAANAVTSATVANPSDPSKPLRVYSLASTYKQAFAGENSEDIIHFLYRSKLNPNHEFDKYYAPVLAGNEYSYGSVGVPSQEMVESYETKDGQEFDWTPWHDGTRTDRPDYESLEPRFQASIVYPGCTYGGVTMDNSVDGKNGIFQQYGTAAYAYNRTVTGYFLRKLIDESHQDLKNTSSAQPLVYLRYAEVLLNKAEAAYRLGLPASEYQGPMNEVRARVGLPGKFTEGDEWFADYRRERKVELSFENHLYWDMRRWRLAHIEYTGYRQHGFRIEKGQYEYVEVDLHDRVFNEKTYCFPIPYSEVVNNNLVNQFPQWQ